MFHRIREYLSKFDVTKIEIKASPINITLERIKKNRSSSGIDKKYLEKDKIIDKLQSVGYSFTGRKKEIDLLNNAIKNKSNVLWISGIMGIGKSSLALNIIDQIKNDDTSLIAIDLKGNSTRPLILDEVRTRIINELQPQTYMPSDTSRLSDLYNNVVSNKKIIIFLDNAQDINQVSHLFFTQKNSQWLMIVTSRKKLEIKFDKVFNLEVKELEKEDAQNFLESLVPNTNIKELSEEITRLCKYSPLAILWAGKFLNNKVDDYKSYVKKLKEEINRIDYFYEDKNIALKVLSVNCGYLEKDEMNDWLDLEIFDSTFNKQALSSIWYCYNGNLKNLEK